MTIKTEEKLMKKRSRILLGAGLVALFSQLYLDVLLSDFRVTCGLIALGIFIYLNKDISPLVMGIASAVSTFLWRGMIFFLRGDISNELLLSFVPELFFYGFFGLFLYLLVYRLNQYPLDRYFMVLVIGDFLSYVIEVTIRILWFDFFASP